MSSGEGLLSWDWTFILTRAITMDGFLLVVPFLGDFYISFHTGGLFSNLLMSWFYRGAFPLSFLH